MPLPDGAFRPPRGQSLDPFLGKQVRSPWAGGVEEARPGRGIGDLEGEWKCVSCFRLVDRDLIETGNATMSTLETVTSGDNLHSAWEK